MYSIAHIYLDELIEAMKTPRNDLDSRVDIVDVPENADYLISDLCGMEKLDNEAARVGGFVRFSFDKIKEMFKDQPVENTVFYAGFIRDNTNIVEFDASVDFYVFERNNVYAMLAFMHDHNDPLVAITKGETKEERGANQLIMRIKTLHHTDKNGNVSPIVSDELVVYQKRPDEQYLPYRDCTTVLEALLLMLEHLTRNPKMHWADIEQDEYPTVETSPTQVAVSYVGSWSK